MSQGNCETAWDLIDPPPIPDPIPMAPGWAEFLQDVEGGKVGIGAGQQEEESEMGDKEEIKVLTKSGREVMLCVNHVHIEGVIGGGRRITVTADVEYSEETGPRLAEMLESFACPVGLDLHL